jgi:protein tyrosine/serine phosphatase
VTDKLCQEANIQYVINMADGKDDIESFIDQDDFDSPWYSELYERDQVCALDMDINVNTEQLFQKLAEGFTNMAHHDGPYLVHCLEGKDRTGVACMLLEALAGASEDEIIQDYMKTYDNYYSVTEDTDAELYSKIRAANIDKMITFITDGESVDPAKPDQLSKYAEKFLVDQGMKPDDVQALKDKLCR